MDTVGREPGQLSTDARLVPIVVEGEITEIMI